MARHPSTVLRVKIHRPLFDKEGRQVRSYSAGSYCIAVKVVDNDGLEDIEFIRLKVNGAVKRTG